MYRISGRLIIIAAVFLALTIADGVCIFIYSTATRNDAAAINALGTVRGSIQRASKIALSGGDPSAAVRIADAELFRCMSDVHFEFSARAAIRGKLESLAPVWGKLKQAFGDMRAGSGSVSAVIALSEECWRIADDSVLALEHASVSSSRLLLYTLVFIAFNICLVGVILWQLKTYIAAKLEYFANYDMLTGAVNRIAFENILDHALRRTGQERRHPMSLMMFDIDHFKLINDTHGHRAGDLVLTLVSKIVKNHIRRTDTFARVGGEEFMLLLMDSDSAHACAFAERLRGLIEADFRGGKYPITASFGVTEWKKNDDKQSIMARVDAALYRAKRTGRNRTKRS